MYILWFLFDVVSWDFSNVKYVPWLKKGWETVFINYLITTFSKPFILTLCVRSVCPPKITFIAVSWVVSHVVCAVGETRPEHISPSATDSLYLQTTCHESHQPSKQQSKNRPTESRRSAKTGTQLWEYMLNKISKYAIYSQKAWQMGIIQKNINWLPWPFLVVFDVVDVDIKFLSHAL